ncbi:MAG: hypothetical protein GY904_09670 [Planctomycetaceae bacterium]|nr:hypothetical protein [Planctomycetaceae bacterium]
MVLLPIAYITFFLMINSKSLMGDALPQGNKRIMLNIAMLVALVAATIGAGWSIWSKAGWWGVGAIALFVYATIEGKLWQKLFRRLDRIESNTNKSSNEG